MMSNFTPGPWKFNPLNDTIEGKNRETICEFCFIKNVADVHALTAAPELLGHLKTAIEYLSKSTPQAKINELFREVRPLIHSIEGNGGDTK